MGDNLDSEDDAQAFENATGVILGRQTALSTSNWFMVYRKGQDLSLIHISLVRELSINDICTVRNLTVQNHELKINKITDLKKYGMACLLYTSRCV